MQSSTFPKEHLRLNIGLKMPLAHLLLFDEALFLCNICVVFRSVLPFGDLLFIHASTNATDDHKYAPLPFDFERAF